MRYKADRPSRLDTLYRAVGGTQQLARLFGRHQVTVNRWKAGTQPLPAWVAERLQMFADDIAHEMIALKHELTTDVRQGRTRIAQARAKQRQTLGQNWKWLERQSANDREEGNQP